MTRSGYISVPADTRRFSWRGPRGAAGSFEPNGRMGLVGERPDLRSNKTGWSTRAPIYAARFFVGFKVGQKERWSMDDVVRIVKSIRTKQVGAPDATFLYQRGLYTSTKDASVVDERGAQVIILNLSGAPFRAFRSQMLDLGEELATRLRQEQVILELQRGGISKETIGVTPV